MSHQQIIQTLIEWIDDHIDQPLNIDVVAKIGLFEMVFTENVPHGHAPDAGEYIRQRRLLLAAQALRSTQRPILISRWILAMFRNKPFPACFAASLTVRRAIIATS